MMRDINISEKDYKKIVRKYFISIGFLIMVFIMRQILIEYQLGRLMDISLCTSTSAEQALLCEGIMSDVLEINNIIYKGEEIDNNKILKISDDLLIWEENQKALETLNNSEIVLKSDEEITETLKKTTDYNIIMEKDIRIYLAMISKEKDMVSFNDQIDKIIEHKEQYLKEIGSLKNKYMLDIDKEISIFRIFESSLFLAMVILIVVNIIFVFLPGEKKINKLFDRLNSCNKNLLSLFMSAQGALFIVMEDTLDIIVMNDEGKKIVSFSKAGDKKRNSLYQVAERMHFLNDDRDLLFDNIKLEESIVNKEVEVRTDEGNHYTYILSSKKGMYKETKVILINLQDITEKKKNEETMMRLALKDELTGLYNRHFLENIVHDELERADNYAYSVSVIMIDIDNFKRVNDKWGHPVGDSVLQQIAATIYENIRNSDYLVRIGGEEFLVFMPNTSINGALKVAEKLRESIENNQHPIAGRYTASFGVAERLQTEGYLSLYSRVDNALYNAKKSGRNCVIRAKDFDSKEAESKYVVWDKSWNCGNDKIDREHKELVDIANSIISITYIPENMGKELEQLDNLIEKITNHFNDEEELLRIVGYPDLEDHIKEHKSLLEIAGHIRAICLKGELNLVYVHSFVVDQMIKEHLIKKDILYFPYIKDEFKGIKNFPKKED